MRLLWMMLVCCTALAFSASARAATPHRGAPHVRATLVADVSSLAPGASFRLGVLLDVEAGWHVYWRNPGDAGLSTEVGFSLPDGFLADELRWPVPRVFTQPGGLVGYGYEGSVLHWVEVRAPRSFRVGSQVTLRGEAAWLACKEICVPDGGPLELVLPVEREASPARRALFDAWQARLPRKPEDVPELADLSVVGTIPTGAEAGDFAIVATWRQPVRDVAWCPAAGDAVGVEKAELSRTKGVDRIRFRILLLGDGAGRILESVLLYTGRDGKRGGIAIPVPLRAGR